MIILFLLFQNSNMPLYSVRTTCIKLISGHGQQPALSPKAQGQANTKLEKHYSLCCRTEELEKANLGCMLLEK